MAKIKCPHCGANNQDVTEKERCWQCDTVLGAPVAVVAEPTAPAAPVLQQVEPVTPPLKSAESSPQSRLPVTLIAIGVVVVLIIIAIVFVILKK